VERIDWRRGLAHGSSRLAGGRSLLAQAMIHSPAAANVRTGAAQVLQKAALGTAGLFQGVGQNGKADRVQVAQGKEALVVGGLGQGRDRGRQPGGPARCWAEGVAKQLADQGSLLGL